MDNETPVWKWAVAAVGVIIVCFFLGYFVLGPTARTNSPTGAQMAEATDTASAASGPPAAALPRVSRAGGDDVVVIKEKTDEIEAKRRKEEEERRKKEEEEEKRRREERQKQDADEPGGRPSAPAVVTGRPDPDDLPTPTTTGPEAPGNGTTETVVAPRTEPSITTGPAPSVPPKETTAPTPAPAVSPTTPAREGEGNPTTPAPPPEGGGATATLYRVRAGSFASRDTAQNRAQELMGRGFSVSTLPEQIGGRMIYHVQVGAFREERRAREVQRELKANGYSASISKG